MRHLFGWPANSASRSDSPAVRAGSTKYTGFRLALRSFTSETSPLKSSGLFLSQFARSHLQAALLLLQQGWISQYAVWHDICETIVMLGWTVIFLLIALAAGILGFSTIAGAAAGIAKILFVIFLVLFIISLIGGMRRTR